MRETSCCLRQTKTYIIEAFNSTSRYSDVLLNIDAPYFEQMVGQIFFYYTLLNLSKIRRILLILKLRFSDLNLSIKYGIVSSKLYDKRDDFNFR